MRVASHNDGARARRGKCSGASDERRALAQPRALRQRRARAVVSVGQWCQSGRALRRETTARFITSVLRCGTPLRNDGAPKSAADARAPTAERASRMACNCDSRRAQREQPARCNSMVSRTRRSLASRTSSSSFTYSCRRCWTASHDANVWSARSAYRTSGVARNAEAGRAGRRADSTDFLVGVAGGHSAARTAAAQAEANVESHRRHRLFALPATG